LTAAHCLDNVPLNQLKIAAGITDNSNGQYIDVAQVIIHSAYDPTTFTKYIMNFCNSSCAQI